MKSIRHTEYWLAGLGASLAAHLAVAAEAAVESAPTAALEIDVAAFRIDVAEHVRQIDAALSKAKRKGDRPRTPMQVAAAAERTRG